MDPIRPGEILLEEYLQPLGISQNAFARAIGVSPRSINEIVLGRRAITPDMSIRFGRAFRQSPRFWLNIQTECDFRQAMRRQRKLTASIRPVAAVSS
jgi:addiction module HigA family antidote